MSKINQLIKKYQQVAPHPSLIVLMRMIQAIVMFNRIKFPVRGPSLNHQQIGKTGTV